MTVASAVIVLVWWLGPAVAILARPRARRSPVRIVGAAVVALTTLVLCFLVVRSMETSSTGSIGFLTLGPVVWLAAAVSVYGMTWRRV
jgi:hypothetical protein